MYFSRIKKGLTIVEAGDMVTSLQGGQRVKERGLLVLFILSLFLFFIGITNRDLWSPDEPRVAEIGREMFETKNFIVPKLNGRAFLEHPPLFYATLALIFMISGKVDDGLARVPPAVFGFLGVLVTSILAYFLFGKSVALLSGIVLSTSHEYFKISHWIVVDSCLSMFIYLACLFFLKGYIGKEHRDRYYALFFISLTCAFFTKGFIGFGIPVVAVIIFLIMDRNVGEIQRMRPIFGLSVFLSSLGLWTLALYLQGGLEYLKVFYIDNNLLRFLPGGESGHRHPFYFYFMHFPISFSPWIIFLIPALILKWDDVEERERKGILFLKVFFICGFTVLSLAETKRSLYALPLFSSSSILCAFLIKRILENRVPLRVTKLSVLTLTLLLALISISIVPFSLSASKSFSVELAKEDLFGLFGVSILMLFLSISSILFFARKKMYLSFFLSTLSLVFFLAFLLIWVGPYLNRFKSYKPFVNKVTEYVKETDRLYGYKPDETLRGFFPFYTGRLIPEIRSPEELLLLAKEKKIFVIVRDKRDELSKELLRMGLKPVFIDRSLTSERSLGLFEN